ncbi:MAG TPA: hypothetical protein VMV04_04780 [Thermodesulfobacteriota bacterium]|nr:hypothetical protein [Thermodesulfobacteriota bacterium]
MNIDYGGLQILYWRTCQGRRDFFDVRDGLTPRRFFMGGLLPPAHGHAITRGVKNALQ